MAFPLLSSPMPQDTDAFHYRGLTAASAAMRRVISMLERLERSRDAVLVSGEAGVGKEKVARAIHAASSSSAGAFVVVDGAAIAAEASDGVDTTSAVEAAFFAAHGGSLFLREVELLPPAVQESIVRLMEAAGSKVRVLASTTRSLEDEVSHARFLGALYEGIARVRLFVPPLRHRPEDVAPLARMFAAEAGARPLAPAILADLASRQWPGNVGELRETVCAMVSERAVRESGIAPRMDGGTGAPVEAGHVGLDEALEQMVDIGVPYAELKEQLVARFTRIYLTQLLAHTKGNRSEAARVAQLDRTYLGRLVGKLGVPVP
jgi:DNA-binding NtrC family response regulator